MPQQYATHRTAAVIRDARLASGMSVPELAAKSGVTRTTLYRLEAGLHAKPQMRTVRALTEHLPGLAERLSAA